MMAGAHVVILLVATSNYANLKILGLVVYIATNTSIRLSNKYRDRTTDKYGSFAADVARYVRTRKSRCRRHGVGVASD